MKGVTVTVQLLLIFVFCEQVRSECSETIEFGALDIYGSVENTLGACSGQGTCVNNTCICNDGWTGRSDWINTEGTDCQIYENSIKFLWGLNIFFSLLCLWFGLPLVHARWDSFKKRRADFQDQGKTYFLWEARPLLSCFVHFGICIPSVMMLGLIRIADDQQRIGLNAASTVLFLLGKASFYASGFLFQPALLEIMISSELGARQDEFKSILRMVNISVAIGGVISTGIAFLAIPIIDDNSLGRSMFASYSAIMAISLIWYAAHAVNIKIRTISVLGAGTGESATNPVAVVREKILEMQSSIIKQANLQCVIYLLFLMVPFLGNKHDYLLPVTWIVYSAFGYRLAATHVNADKPQKVKMNKKRGVAKNESVSVDLSSSASIGNGKKI